jgi:lactate dehydrogenase-like 2-hydroxyacid dehydrogenase
MTSELEILQVGALPPSDEEQLAAAYRVHSFYTARDKDEFLAGCASGIRAVVTRGDLGANTALIAALPRLELIAIYGVGYDAIDMDLCHHRGIRVTNTPDVLTGDVADHAVAMMLALWRGIPEADRWVRSGDWATIGAFPLTKRVHGRRAGILGLGRIGHAIARRVAAFDMPVAYCNRKPDLTAAHLTFVENPVELAERSDVLFVALAASAATRRIVSRSVLHALGPDGMLVNVSRASNVDEPALLDALESGALGSAALDVFENEPRLDQRYVGLKNMLLQPHHGSATVETRQAMGQLMRDNLAAHFGGRALPTPLN